MSAYGSISHNNHTGANGTAGNDEETALLGHKDAPRPIIKRAKRHMTVKVDKKHGDLILLLCYIITGLLDSCATAVWGSFVSMQTGNTIYFGLGLADPYGSSRWIRSGTSIAMFSLGSFFFARFHRYLGPEKRWVLFLSFVLQLCLIVAAAIITTLYPRHGNIHLDWHVLLPIGMIAFQSSGQAVTSRVLKYGSLTSVVLTSIYCDLFSDSMLFAPPSANAERNRRVAAPILLVIGALFGGLWSKSPIGISGALWTAAGLKLVICFAWLLWRKDPADDDDADG